MVRRLRLISGLILFAYVVTHFINHGLGIVSIAAMEAMLSVVYPIWSYPPITFVLYGASGHPYDARPLCVMAASFAQAFSS